MTNEERKYKIFNIFYHSTAPIELQDELKKDLIKERMLNSDSFKAMNDGIMANLIYHKIKDNKAKYEIIEYHYNILLENMIKLSRELNLENSLELCILYSYLLWGGYLSKDKAYEFNDKDIQRIDGIHYADIMTGRGVCLNISDMLKDFLNKNNYKSAIITNHYSKKTKLNYRIDISKKNSEEKQTLYKKVLEEIRLARKADHAFNLIEDNNGMYIFDSTNLILHNVISPYISKIINGSGKYKMFPYLSYIFCCSKTEREVLDKLLTSDEYNCPYDKTDIIAISETNIELLRNSLYLLEDFYKEVKPNIQAISQEMVKIKMKVK